MPGKNWTYVFQIKDQIGSFFYFPSINFHKAGGGFGPIRVNNREVIKVPFSKPEAEFDLLIGDWYQRDFKVCGYAEQCVFLLLLVRIMVAAARLFCLMRPWCMVGRDWPMVIEDQSNGVDYEIEKE